MWSPALPPDTPWWQGRTPSLVLLLVVVGGLGLATMAVGSQVFDVLPEVGKDQLGQDLWNDPIGLEDADGIAIAHIPDCASGAVTRIALWDADSKPYWEVAGLATPLTAFFVGVAPSGFTEIAPYVKPPPGTVLRLVVFRKVGGAAGIRYVQGQLRTNRVVSGNPLSRYTISGFQTAKVCGDTVTKPTYRGTGTVPFVTVGD